MIKGIWAGVSLVALASPAWAQDEAPICQRELVVLGAGQDAGAPQIGNAEDDGPRLLPSSIALIDRKFGQRYLFDATPAITEQLALLDTIEPPKSGLGVDGVFLTHAHIGHYLGLAYFGREAANASKIPVYAMPRMAEFLRTNGPWSQLVELGNVELVGLLNQKVEVLEGGFAFVPITVPHRDEYSETVGFFVILAGKTVFYLPDLDSWNELAERTGIELAELLGRADYAFVDATFWDDNELKGRDMSEIPHPRVTQTMDLLQDLPALERAKVHFIHYNHTNPIRDPDSPESKEVIERGFNVARRGDRICLD
uniref:MBL fold metallo-hydrolase n=1 Tax=uncultured Altererythrobacter sp. TaxID=500840 RepID=UPI00263693C2|nr:MBL fold metallo-hydrolase [uncultured Altererythrobacter sp.]